MNFFQRKNVFTHLVSETRGVEWSCDRYKIVKIVGCVYLTLNFGHRPTLRGINWPHSH